MIIRLQSYFIFSICFLLACMLNLSMQAFSVSADSTKQIQDTLLLSASAKQSKGIDSTVSYSARDSVVLFIKKKKMILNGDAEITLKKQELKAENIELDFNLSVLKAEGLKDSTGKMYGFPKFNDNGEDFIGEKILFNLETKKGTITMGETKADEGGFFFGSKVKKMSENSLFIQNGCYTTCTKPHPHFYFGSPSMKVIVNDKIFMDPIMLYVEDVPVFIIPFGLYFPNKTGRSSGVLVNPPYFSTVDGVVFQNLGYYFALSDYFDTQLTADLFSKTGFLIRNSWRYNVSNQLTGSLSLEYGRRRLSQESPLTDNWRIIGNHNHILSPQTRINASVNIATQSFNNRFATDLNQRIQQSLFSNAGYSTSFDNGSSLGIDISSTQNIVTKEYSINPNFSFNIPTFFPVKKLISGNSWLSDIGISYFVRGALTQNHSRNIIPAISDTSFSDFSTAVIRHNPSISISPKFGYFSITPSISYSENWFFRKLNRRMNPIDSSIEDSFTSSIAPLREYSYQFALGISTRLFGIIKPNIAGINAVRHTLTPSFSMSFSPEYSSSTSENIKSYFDYNSNKQIEYSLYEKDGGRGPNKTSTLFNYSFSNRFEAKISQGDSAEKNLDLLQLDIQGNYNPQLDSLRFSSINTSFRTISLGKFNLNGSAGFTLYDDAINVQGITVPTSRFLQESGKGLIRLTYFTANISTNFSSGTFSNEISQNDSSDILQDNVGDRFSRRMNEVKSDFDYFGENGRGYSAISIPWTLNGSLTYNYNEPVQGQIIERCDIRADFSINLTPTWTIKSALNYDLIYNNIIAPSISISKDLDCWELSANWFPSGFNQGFILRFGAKASQLRDMAITKRNLPAYR